MILLLSTCPFLNLILFFLHFLCVNIYPLNQAFCQRALSRVDWLNCKQILNSYMFNSHSAGTKFTMQVFCNVTCKTIQRPCISIYSVNVLYFRLMSQNSQFTKCINCHRSDYECQPPLNRHLRSLAHSKADINLTDYYNRRPHCRVG